MPEPVDLSELAQHDTDVPGGDHLVPENPAAAEARALNTQNQAKAAELGARGVEINPLHIVEIKLNALADLLVGGETSAAHAEYQLAFQRRLAASLASIVQDVNRKTLLAGITQPPPAPANRQARRHGR